MMSAVPVAADVSYDALLDDPYPIFRRVRDMAPAVFVAAANLTLVTRFDDIMKIERDPATYSSDNPASLVNKVMGPTFMRKDGAEHAVGRKAIEPSFRPGTIKEHWAPKFAEICEGLIDSLIEAGEADLFPALAAPMASLSLMEMIGFKEMPWETLALWSQSLIDGAGNYSRDAEIERKAMEAGAGIDAAIEAVLDHHRAHPNPSILSSMVHADPPMPIEGIRANIKVIIGGGLNEPRDAILTLTLGLLANSDSEGERSRQAGAMANRVRGGGALDLADRHVSAPRDARRRSVRRDASGRPADWTLRRRGESRRQALRRSGPVRHLTAEAIAPGLRCRRAFLRGHLGLAADGRQDRGADAVRTSGQSSPPR